MWSQGYAVFPEGHWSVATFNYGIVSLSGLVQFIMANIF